MAGRQPRSLNLSLGPLTIDITFVIIAVLFSLRARLDLSETIIWMIVVAISIAVHEFGHWGAFRRYGVSSNIVLHFFGGVTSPTGGTITSTQSIVVSAAGPVVGIVVGGMALVIRSAIGPLDDTTANWAVDSFIRAAFFWSFVNLLPLLPLDGGSIMLDVLSGRDPERGPALAYRISMGTAALAILWGLSRSDYFIAFGAGLFALLNYQALKTGSRPQMPIGVSDPGALQKVDKPQRLSRKQRKAAKPKKVRQPVEQLLAKGEEALWDGDSIRARTAGHSLLAEKLSALQGANATSLVAWAEVLGGNGPLAQLALDAVPPKPPPDRLLAACVALLNGFPFEDVAGDVVSGLEEIPQRKAAGQLTAPPRAAAPLLARDDVLDALIARLPPGGEARVQTRKLFTGAGLREAAQRLDR